MATLLSLMLLLADATIRGRVLDSTGAALPGVTVEASAGGVTRATVTGSDGTYALRVPPGTYDVSFQLRAFATSVRRGVVAHPGATVEAGATLSLGASADVVVTAPADDLTGIAGAASEGVVAARDLGQRPVQRAGDVLETVPGVIVSQHSGEGKANQYYLRGFNLDHGTDLAVTVAGVPANMPTHAHGQGYADANFLIPELIGLVQYIKGPYSAEEGDFASAGAVHVNYVSVLDAPLALVQGGSNGFGRALVAASPRIGEGSLLYALEATMHDGPWVHPDELRRLSGVLRYTRGGFGVTAMAYDARWRATDQIPSRAVGALTRFGSVDPSDGGTTSRYVLASEWQRGASGTLTHASAYAMRYRLRLFSNFTYFLDHPEEGDQFEQADDRMVYGGRASHRRLARWGSVSFENLIGMQTRHDDIRNVGLYHTRNRVRLETTRQDRVRETSVALYGQSAAQWSPRLRTVAGVRVDRYRFDVAAAEPRDASIVSPKLTMIFGPWRNAGLYANAGTGFHSNDARGVTERDPAMRATPLVRTRGAELGLRATPAPRLHLTAAWWGLDMASELLFVGDAGTTEASRPSRRTGVELSARYDVRDWLAIDADYAHSRARFRDVDPAGDRIPGAVEGVASVALRVIDLRRVSGEVRYRYFGPRPLVEDDSVRSDASHLVHARAGYRIAPRVRLDVDVFNVLDAEVSDVDYFYTSRLPGEPAGGIHDLHFHPVEGRAVRVGMTTSF
ncbi:MAG TPA: TonB-dependent receptor [Thermoanaerobaculia bacterium]|nr:TonB-dependent receptor [Thermoanaerobaculia bacterium]